SLLPPYAIEIIANFFFQAEDGIRDFHVTGVQTCALPILRSGYALTGIGLELNAIAAVVIGGTMLTGGVGFVLGSSVGVLIFGLIQVLIAREGLGDSWWARIFIGAVVLVFIVLQRLLMTEIGRAHV